jgi:ABC-type amino acid transport substrate-binding protein
MIIKDSRPVLRPFLFSIISTKLKRLILIFFFALTIFSGYSQNDTLTVHCLIKPPFAVIGDNGSTSGVEIEIINEYVLWLKTFKKINVTVKHVPFTEFATFYNVTKKSGKQTIGLGAVTILPERLKEVDFAPAYLKNVAFCITNGNAPDIKSKVQQEVIKGLGSMTALTTEGTSLNKHVTELKKFIPDLKISFQPNQLKILDEIAKNVLYFGYVDAIEFWFYLKNNPQKFLKMQKALNQSKEELAFVLPKGSPHKALFTEFFSGQNGFKNSRNYRTILEKYLGSYMTQMMAIN